MRLYPLFYLEKNIDVVEEYTKEDRKERIGKKEKMNNRTKRKNTICHTCNRYSERILYLFANIILQDMNHAIAKRKRKYQSPLYEGVEYLHYVFGI